MARSFCSICISDTKSEVVNTLLAAGRSPNFIEVEMKSKGLPVKSETIRKHHQGCLRQRSLDTQAKAMADAAKGRTVTTGDFATLVQQEALRALEEGRIRVRTQDGLAAQALLDRRAEKQKDRDLMLNLARLMTGSRPPEEVIEGEYREVSLALASGD